MKSLKPIIRSTLQCVMLLLAIMVTMRSTIDAQIRLNEIEVDTPSDISEPCEYIEVAGTPNATVAANTFFLSIDGDTGVFGQVNYIANLGGVQFGSNGTITIITNSDVCGGRAYPAGTNVVQSTSF